MTFEVCCGSIADAMAAQAGEASRIELNSALPLGGLTPEIGTLHGCLEQLQIPIVAMVRPRAGGFCYTSEEYHGMLKSADMMLQAGVAGLAFGFLHSDLTVDSERTKEFVTLIHSYGKEAVFHRAVDVTADMNHAVETLIALQVDRILTSGGCNTALEGAKTIAKLQSCYGNQIELLAGSGIRADNVEDVLMQTGVKQIHSSCKGWAKDNTAKGEQVSFCEPDAATWDAYQVVSLAQVQQLKQAILDFGKKEQKHENI